MRGAEEFAAPAKQNKNLNKKTLPNLWQSEGTVQIPNTKWHFLLEVHRKAASECEMEKATLPLSVLLLGMINFAWK